MSRSRITLRSALVVCAAALIAVGCGSDDSDSDSGSSSSSDTDVTTPEPLEAGGDMVICTDVPYPPAQFQEGSEFKGYEVEMGEEVAERLGVTAVHQKTGFDGIIGALLANKCDAIISSMNVTPEREEQVAFVEYMNIGQAVAVAPEDEGTIESLDDLAGKTVAVQLGTTLGAAIDEANKSLDEKIEVRSFPDAGAAAAALKTDKVDAFFSDAPVIADYVNKDPESFAMGGTQIDVLPAGIAMRPGDTELVEAVQDAIDAMYEDGTLEEIFAKWKVDDFLLDVEAGDDEADDAMDSERDDSMESDDSTSGSDA
jgi:polar amino acid transport system substrate-binding protein